MRQLEKQEKLQAKADVALRSKTPIRMLENTIRQIGCRCQVEDMRQGVYCDTCFINTCWIYSKMLLKREDKTKLVIRND